jgi:uncharacterized integral membrane protein
MSRTTQRAPAPQAPSDLPPGPASDPPPAPRLTTARARDAAARSNPETRGEHFRRHALRGRLRGYAVASVAIVALLIALAASNTAQVKINWLVGSSRISLVWLLLATAVLGWGLGLLISARLRWRTRAPRQSSGSRS